MNNFNPRSKVFLAEIDEPVIEQPIDETRDDVVVVDTPQDSTHEMTSTQVPRRSGRIVRPPIRFTLMRENFETISEVPELDSYTYEEAMKDIDAPHWIKAMKSELDSMYSNQVWDLVKAPNGIKPVSCKWVYKRKRGIDRKVETFKVRLVTKDIYKKKVLIMKKPFHQYQFLNLSEFSYPLLLIMIMRFDKWMS